MKIRILNNGLLIEPETDFEVEYIKQFQLTNPVTFVKTGSTPNDIIGLKILDPSKEKVNEIRE